MPSTPLDLLRCAAFQMCSSSGKPEVYPGDAKPHFIQTEKVALDRCPACFSPQCAWTISDPRHQAPLFLPTAAIEYP
jgi:hypothetical protein